MTRDEKRLKRIEAWYNQEIPDEALSDADLKFLQERVFAAVAQKVLQRDDVHTFADHRTLQ